MASAGSQWRCSTHGGLPRGRVVFKGITLFTKSYRIRVSVGVSRESRASKPQICMFLQFRKSLEVALPTDITNARALQLELATLLQLASPATAEQFNTKRPPPF